jgi:serine/threonine-protein kinase
VNSSDSGLETAAQPPEAHRVATDRFAPGTLLAGRYRIVAPLGKGGMGEVYRAEDLKLGQPVALKFLPAALATDSTRLDRLIDEVRIGRQISHPNVCRLYDVGEADGHHFLVMEYVDGEDLASLLHRIGRLPADKALQIARHLCAGLAAAHDKGVIHRDLKPANVMIDGHGHARIADFGLAALADSRGARDVSGTPAYMAPEQLAGEGASLRSDVFALGLVLYEMFAGKRAFEASSLEELRALHAKPPSLSSAARDVDPGVERVVLRCLARAPADRPASAHAVMAALPGGDPLQAALLAGETPSPEMVAAAGKVGDVSAGRAWLGFLGGLAMLLAITGQVGRQSLFRMVPLSKSPELLEERAQQILSRLGYGAPPADTARGLLADVSYLAHVQRQDRSATRWDKLRSARPSPLAFWYRQSPRKMSSNSWIPVLPWLGPPELGRILRADPPQTLPGMASVVLDTEGRLIGFSAVPPRYDADPGPWPAPDWSILLREADLDEAAVTSAKPRWTASVDSDSKAAWDVDAQREEARVHVEAAAYHGRPVYFEVQGTWVRPPAESSGEPLLLIVSLLLSFAVLVAIVVAVVALVRRNLRMGRGDRRGSLRLALFMFSALVLGQLCRADHTSAAANEYSLLIAIVSQGAYGALASWSLYMAIEPAVRRRWPHMLISWARVLAGRLSDPLVGRDALLGLLFGLAALLGILLADEVGTWLGRSRPLSVAVLSTLSSPRHLAFYFATGAVLGIIHAVGMLFVLYLIHSVVRLAWLARALLGAFLFLPVLALASDSLVGVVQATLFTGLALFALIRFGLLPIAVLLFTYLVMLRAPLTFDWHAWYFGRSFAALFFFAAALAASAYVALGGKPLFGRALLED